MTYKPNDHYISCDICSFKCYRSEARKTYNNLIVCQDCYDGPNLDKPPRLIHERQAVADPRPEGHDTPTILSTTTVTSIASTTAASGGNITHDGGSTVTEHGVCWSTSHAPTTSDDRTSDGTGTGTFTSNLTGLTASTTYYVRAYATNVIGTSYGVEIEFTTTS